MLAVTTTGAQSLTAFRWEVFQREASLRATQEQLRTALARAESAVALRSRLVTNVSHELRTPVNVIIGYADMLLDPTLAPPEVADLAGRVRGYGVTLESLVSGLLDLSRLSCGKVEIALADRALSSRPTPSASARSSTTSPPTRPSSPTRGRSRSAHGRATTG